ncbi:MAG: hypothetical protein ACFB9M_10305 [Myxococcota bacterium]
MAKATPDLIRALRETADRLASGARFQWTHMGCCNCGHLAQTVTRLGQAHLHRIALEKAGDWAQQARDFCPDSGYPMDYVIQAMVDLGLSTNDIADLERLSGDRVLKTLPPGMRGLDRRNRDHAVLYMRAWAELLASELDGDANAEGSVDVRDVAAAGRVRTLPERA